MSSLRKEKPGIVEGEYLLTAEDFRKIAAIMHADSGIYLAETKATLVYSRLAKRLRLLGLENFREYCALVSDTAADERQKMLAALTTNLTKFFREPHHFEHLKTKVLPPLLAKAKRGDRVRIWSAACSNGQEPYSIAMTILSLMPDAASYDVRVLASDLDPNMVAEGAAGIYSDSTLSAVPGDLRSKWFRRVQQDGVPAWEVGDEMHRMVSFRELNLIGQWPMKGRFHAILCRNVVIYFEEETQSKIWSRFMPLLEPGGVLYIGHSERLSGPAAARFETDGLTTYRLIGSEGAR